MTLLHKGMQMAEAEQNKGALGPDPARCVRPSWVLPVVLRGLAGAVPGKPSLCPLVADWVGMGGEHGCALWSLPHWHGLRHSEPRPR